MLSAQLLTSIDPDATTQQAHEKFSIPADEEPSDQQIEQVEQDRMRAALKPFHNPKPPHSLHPERLWQAYETVEPDKVQGHGGKQLVDVVALVRHALDPNSLLAPIGLTVEERYQQWLADQAAAGATFTPEQRRWIDAIKDHIATSLAIDRDDLDEVPFNQIGGLGRAFELFGDRLATLLTELNDALAA